MRMLKADAVDATPRACTICGTLFQPRRKTTGEYCSRKCSRTGAWLKSGGAERNALIARATAAERGAKQRRTGTKGYVKWFGRHEHRVVAERMLGRALSRKEVVHHIDGNPHNNDLSNLMVITQAEHMREHGLALPGVTPAHKPWEHKRTGQDSPQAKLSNADVVRIREMAFNGGKQNDIGAIFDLTQSHVSAIVTGKRWSHV